MTDLKGHSSSRAGLELEPPFRLDVRAESNSGDGHAREASLSAVFESTRSFGQAASDREQDVNSWQHSPSGQQSATTGLEGTCSPAQTSRASSARSASLYPAAGSSWGGNLDARGSHEGQSPELSTRSLSRAGYDSHLQDEGRGLDAQFASPMTASDVSAFGADSASFTATPVDLQADVDSILCTSFWRS